MIRPGEIQHIANTYRVRDRQIEKDYIITWILRGISQTPRLFNNLVFKGGTVLKKAYFPNYRFSEDLDFTLLDDDLSNDLILSEFDQSFVFIEEDANITLKRGVQHEHLSSKSINFHITYQGPLGGKLGSKDLKVDLTRQEVLEFDVSENTIFTEYSDLTGIAFKIKCYQLPEILIEKMVALMGRTIPRDVYDVWYLIAYGHIDIQDYVFEFERKAIRKGHDPEKFLNTVLAKEHTLKRDWVTSLCNQVRDLPGFDDVMRELKKHFRKI